MSHVGQYVPADARGQQSVRASDPTELLDQASWRLGQFQVLERLGRGASASVWLARPRFSNENTRKVALKVFSLDHRDARTMEDGTIGPGGRVVEEAYMLGLISHPNVVNFYNLEWDPEKKLLGLAMEYIDGKTLADKLDTSAPLPVAEVLKIGSAIAGALTEIDRVGLVHRDVKPANIVQSGNTYKLIDFGIAATRAQGNVTTFEGIPIETGDGSSPSGVGLFGTVGYIDPEHYAKGLEPDHLSDIYSLGATLYEALTGMRPAASEKGLDATILQGNALPPTITARGVAVPKPLASLIARMIHSQPKMRPPHARVVQAECDAIARFLQSRGARVAPENNAPFKGLAPYGEDDAEVFFWRDTERATAIQLLRDTPVLVVQGRTGVGKTSFVCAGVLPEIERGRLGPFPQRWHTCRLRAVPGVVNQIFAEIQAARIAPGDLLEALVEQAGSKHVGYAFFLDDADGMATLAPDEQEWLLQLVHEVLEFPQSCFRVILGMNEATGLPSDLLRSLASNTLPLTPIPPAAWSVIIDKALAAYGYVFESDDLRNLVIQEAQAHSASVALTQFALQELWEQRDQERKLISQDAWEMCGGFTGAIARHANRTLERINEALTDGGRLARGLLVQLVAPDGSRATLGREELLRAWPESERVLDALVAARLVKDVGGRVRIVHQVVIDNWLALAEWVDANRGNAMFRRSLAGAAALFSENRAAGVPWRGTQLTRARALPRETLTADETTFIDESVYRSHRRLLRTVVLYVVAGAVLIISIAWLRSHSNESGSVSIVTPGDLNTKEKVVSTFFQLSPADQKAALREIDEAQRPNEVALPRSLTQQPPPESKTERPAEVKPTERPAVVAARPTPVAPASPLVPAAATPTPKSTPEAQVPGRVERVASHCLAEGSKGPRFVNVIVRGDGSVGWSRFEGEFTPAEKDCVSKEIARHTFPTRAGDITLARVPLGTD